MAFREVSVVQVREAPRRWLRGDGERPIAKGVGVDRKTARRYITAAVELGVDRSGGEERLTDELIGQVVERVRPHRSDGHGEAWRSLLDEEDRIKTWVSEDLTVVKIGILLARRGVVVPHRTLARFAVQRCGAGRRSTTVRVAPLGRHCIVVDVTSRHASTNGWTWRSVWSTLRRLVLAWASDESGQNRNASRCRGCATSRCRTRYASNDRARPDRNVEVGSPPTRTCAPPKSRTSNPPTTGGVETDTPLTIRRLSHAGAAWDQAERGDQVEAVALARGPDDHHRRGCAEAVVGLAIGVAGVEHRPAAVRRRGPVHRPHRRARTGTWSDPVGHEPFIVSGKLLQVAAPALMATAEAFRAAGRQRGVDRRGHSSGAHRLGRDTGYVVGALPAASSLTCSTCTLRCESSPCSASCRVGRSPACLIHGQVDSGETSKSKRPH